MNPETKPEAEEMIEELRALVSEAEKILATASPSASEATLAALRRRWEAAQERLEEMYAGTKDRVAAGARATDRAVREHPYQSLFIAAGLGVIVGLVLGRKSE